MKKLLALILMAVMLLSSSAFAMDLDLYNESTPPSVSSNAEKSKEMTLNFDSSYKITPRDKSGEGFEFQYVENEDMSIYKYINAYIYSPRKDGGKIDIRVYDAVYSDGYSGRKRFDVDWIGWKLVSFPLNEVEKSNNYTTDWSKITKINFLNLYTMAGWSEWAESDSLYIDRIWVSEENPYAIPKIDGEIEIESVGTHVSESTEHKRIKEKSLKLTTWTDWSDHWIYFKPIDITEYNYMNMWIYSPSNPQYSDGETTKTPFLRFRLNDGNSNAQTANPPEAYINWGEEWKLVSMPLSAFDWQSNLGTDDDDDKTRIQKMNIITNPTTNGSFKESTHLYFDKIWFSKDIPLNSSVNKPKFTPQNDGDDFYSFDNMLKIEFDENVILDDPSGAKVDGKDATLCQLTPNTIGVIMNEKFGENSKNYVLSIPAGTVYGKNGLDNSDIEEEITTAAENVTAAKPEEYGGWYKWGNGQADESKLSTTVKVFNTTSQDKDVVLYLAVYNGKELVQLAASEHTVANGVNFIETPELNGYREGYVVKSFIWIKDGLKPLVEVS